MLVYHETQPSPQLARYIDCFWNLESTADFASLAPETVPPDGRIEIVFNLADPFRRHRLNHSTELQPLMLAVGQMRAYTTIEPTGRVNLFGLRFRPGGACAFFGLPLSELANQILPLTDLWPLQARELAERIHAATSLTERGRVSEAFLLRHLLRADKLDAMVEAGVQRILQNNGCLSSGSLLEGMNISERQLERKFQAKVGLSPKQLARVIRFQKIFTAYERNPLGSWISLAYECGYYDQAHLIRDFKEFSGQNPSGYFQQESDLARYLTHHHRMSEFSKTDD